MAGTLSRATGGKFANGAAFAAFSWAVSVGVANSQSEGVVNKGNIESTTAESPLEERVRAAEKALEALATDGKLDTNKVFTGDKALDNAAVEVLDAVHPISEKYNVEIGGRLVANGEGGSYEMPVVGNETSVKVDPNGALGGYHTHPGGARYAVFSNQYNTATNRINGTPGDAGWVDRNRIPLYMSNRANGKTTIRVCAPSSARCRPDFVPFGGINRGVSGDIVR